MLLCIEKITCALQVRFRCVGEQKVIYYCLLTNGMAPEQRLNLNSKITDESLKRAKKANYGIFFLCQSLKNLFLSPVYINLCESL